MARTDFQIDGWKVGDLLPGSLESAQNDALVELMYDGENKRHHLTDQVKLILYLGLHFHPAGYEILYQEITKLIAELWPDQAAEKLSTVLPGWNDEESWGKWVASKPSR